MNKKNRHPADGKPPVTLFGPDFPFAFDDWLEHPAGLGSVPADRHGEEVAIVGAGIAGLAAGWNAICGSSRPPISRWPSWAM